MEAGRLIGREALLVALARILDGADERGHGLVLVGEPGIGRTSFLEAAAELATGLGRLVVRTAGSEAETALGYAGLHALLRPLLPWVPQLPEVQQRALLAALGLRDPDERRAGLIVPVATLRLLELAGADTGVVVVADDVHWLDEDTRHVLSFVARRLGPRHLVLASAATHWPGFTAFGAAFDRLSLERLTDAEAHRLVAGIGGGLDRARRMWVVAQAAGNPLAITELAGVAAAVDVTVQDTDAASWSLTPALERAFAAPIDALPARSRDLLLVAAVAADANLQEVLAAACDLRDRLVTTADLDAPLDLGLITVRRLRVAFRHPLVRAAVVQREPVSRRQAAHRALGAVITVNADRRAWHRALGAVAHDDSVAAELEATATRTGRHRDARATVAALERAAYLSAAPLERGRRLLLAASHAARFGQHDTVERLLVLALAGPLSDADAARVELLRESDDGVVADGGRVLQLCRDARSALAAGDAGLAVGLVGAAARRRCAAPLDEGVLDELRALTAAVLAACPDDARAWAAYALADPVGHGRDVIAEVARVEEAPPADGDELSAYAVAARAAGDYAAAARLFDRAEIPLRARGLLATVACNLAVVADVRVELGEWDRAAAALTAFTGLSAECRSPSHRTSALATSAKLAALRGAPDEALDLVAELEADAGVRSGSRFLARAQTVRGVAALAVGRHADAYELLAQVFDTDAPVHHVREQLDAVAHLAEAAAYTARRAEARRIVDRMRRLAAASGSPTLVGQVAYADAVLADDDLAEDALLRALGSPLAVSPWYRARVQLAQGRWLRRQHRVTQSRTPLTEALGIFRRLGARRWAAEAAAELEATGIDGVDGTQSAAPVPLSNQELRIAQLAAQGLSNREIGQQMYLSARTVSSHLYRIFPKLGITARGQIAARLAGKADGLRELDVTPR